MVTYTCTLCNQYSTKRHDHFHRHLSTCVGTCNNSNNINGDFNETDNSNINDDIIDQFTNDKNESEIYSDHEYNINDDNLDYHDVDDFDHGEIFSDYNSDYDSNQSCNNNNEVDATVDANNQVPDEDTVTSNNSKTNEESSESNDNVLNELESSALKFFIDHSIPISSFDEFVSLFSLAQSKNLWFSDAIKKNGKSRRNIYQHLVTKLQKEIFLQRHIYTINTFVLNNVLHKIPSFPFLLNVKSLLCNKELMKDGLFSYDEKSNVYSEFNTGTWWQIAEDNLYHKNKKVKNDRKNHILVPLIFFVDKTHVTNNGKIKAEPMLCSIGNIKFENRTKKEAWFNLGFIPQILQSQVKTDEAHVDVNEAQYYQLAIDTILAEVYSCCSNNEGFLLDVVGFNTKKTVHFEVAMIIGDMVGHDDLCCHMKGYSSETKRPFRMCYVTHDNLDNPYEICVRANSDTIFDAVDGHIQTINKREYGTVGPAREKLKDLSQLPVIPAFDAFHFGGFRGGLLQCTPVETLHALLKGVIERSLKCLYDYRVVVEYQDNSDSSSSEHTLCSEEDQGDSDSSSNSDSSSSEQSSSSEDNVNTNSDSSSSEQSSSSEDNVKTKKVKVFWTEEFERRIVTLSRQYSRQSDRNLPRAIFNNGVTKLGNFSAQEYIGLSLLTIIALPGCIKMDDKEEALAIELAWSDLLWKGISIYICLSSYKIRKDKLQELDLKIRCYVKTFKDVCEDQCLHKSEGVGTKLPKLHSLLHVTDMIVLFGSPQNFFGGFMESLLKEFVKHPAIRSRLVRQGFTFLSSTSQRWSEYNCINDYHLTKYSPSITTCNNMKIPNRGLFHNLKAGKVPFKFEYNTVQKKWNTITKDKEGTRYADVRHPYYELEKQEMQALKQFLNNMATDANNIPTVECHYQLTFDIMNTSNNKVTMNHHIIKCNPSFNNSKWFDWIRIKFEKGTGVGQIHLFLICHYNDNNDSLLSNNTYFLAKTLKKYEADDRKYHFLPGWHMDKFENKSHVIDLDSFQSVTTVLTGVHYDKSDLNNEEYYSNKETAKKYFEKKRNEYFIHLPFTDEWGGIGWNNRDLKEIKDNLDCTQDGLSDVDDYDDRDHNAEYISDSDMVIDYSASEDESHSSMELDVSES